MKLFLHIMLGACLCWLPALGNNTQEHESDANIVGHVTDKKSGNHLAYISVTIKSTTLGTLTDATGHYYLKNLPEGNWVAEAHAVGYQTASKAVTLQRGETLEINFELEEDVISLDGVVVSANRNETKRRTAPTLVNVVDAKTFETTNSNCLAQGLNFQPGVRVENNCQNCGFQQVRINGLDGPYTQILVDSRPIFSALSGVYGLEQIPANMIERVEVMRGGGSALFGSSAIAGTINIITKEPVRNMGQASHLLTRIGNSNTWDNHTTLNVSMVTDDQKTGLYLFAQNHERSGYDDDDDGYTELPKLENQTLGLRSYLKTTRHSRLTLEYHHLQEFRRGGDHLNLPPHEADVAEQTEHAINTGGLNFEYFSPDDHHKLSVYSSMQHIHRDSYYGGGQDLNAYGSTKDLTWVVGSQYTYRFDRCLFMPAELTGGLEYNQDDLHDNMWGYGRKTDQKIGIAGAFFQNEWKTNRWGLLLGGRLDKHNLMDHVIFSPRANLRFNPTEDINFRLNYSFGFRAPQAFDEDLHIANVGGTVSMIRLDDHLTEEKSQSVSLSSDIYKRMGNWQANLLVEGFFTTLDDVFSLRQIGIVDGILMNERYNESGANVFGTTLEGKLAYRNRTQLQAGLTLQEARYKKARAWSDDESLPLEKRMMRTPRLYGYFTFSHQPTEHLTLALSGTYTGSMLVEHRAGYIEKDRTEKTPDFLEMNLKVTHDFHIHKNLVVEVNAGVQNLFNAYQKDFDQGPDRDSGYMYGPTLPRSIFAGLKIKY